MQNTRTIYINNLNERLTKERLRSEIHRLCEPFGKIAAIYVSKSLKKRGQAFVAYESSESANEAIEQLKDKLVFQKKINVAAARSPSLIHMDADSIAARRTNRSATPETNVSVAGEPTPIQDATSAGTEAAASVTKEAKDYGEPHSTLLLQNIPSSVTLDDLKQAGAEFTGFLGARMFAIKHVGFMDFDSEESAGAAIENLDARDLGDITYAKK